MASYAVHVHVCVCVCVWCVCVTLLHGVGSLLNSLCVCYGPRDVLCARFSVALLALGILTYLASSQVRTHIEREEIQRLYNNV